VIVLIDAQGKIKQLFPTLMMRQRLNNVMPLNSRLREIVLDVETRDSGIQASNYGGWHSGADLLDWPYQEVNTLATEFLKAGRELTSSILPAGITGNLEVKFEGGCWANVSREGNYNKVHNHPGSMWSGCYYVCTGAPEPEPKFNGWIEFQDPRPGNIYGGKERVEPEAGMLLLFPGWLNHYVNPFIGAGERISIAFNLNAEVTPDAPLTQTNKAAPTVKVPTSA